MKIIETLKRLLFSGRPVLLTSKDGESLTEDEMVLVGEFVNTCPDCGNSFLYGPTGGGSQNVACEHCGSEFNIMLPFGIERISDRGPRSLGDRRELYRTH